MYIYRPRCRRRLRTLYGRDPTRNPKYPGIGGCGIYDLLDHIRVCGRRYWIAREKKNPFGGDQCSSLLRIPLGYPITRVYALKVRAHTTRTHALCIIIVIII